MSITVYTKDGQFTAPLNPSRKLFFVLRDWEISDFTGDILRPNRPCVFRCGDIENNRDGHYAKLNQEWQFFMFDLASKIVYDGRTHQDLTKTEYDWLAGKFTSVFANSTAFTNQNGFDIKANFITGERLNDELPKIYTLVCGGASVSGTIAANSKGMQMLKVDHFNGAAPPPPVETINPYTDPRVFFATTITGVKVNGGYKVNRFPQYGGKDVPVPLIASKDIYYPIKDLRAVENGIQKPSPYYP